VGAGEVIGEASCLNFQPRSATVRAAEDTVVLEMLRNAFDILRRNKSFKAEMEKKYRARALDNHLRSVPILRKLPQEFVDYLRERVELVSYSPGEAICKQGDVADAFFLVRMGHVKVFESYADGQVMVLSYLSRGQYFGEMGLLGGGERTASCSALDHVELVRIGKADFEEMVRRYGDVRKELEQVAHERAAANKLRASQNKTLSLPQYIDQGLYQAQSLLILDLEKCTRCDECVRACAQAHDGVSRLIRDGIRYDKYLVTTSCRSCRDPYCMVGCPVGSIRRKNDLEIIIEDWCIGCGRCAEQCPYGNINMHPFEVEVRDLSTGSVRKEVRKKAAVCDLCTDQCLTENEDPSCVYACPHDAAHRVDGQTFFDEHLLGANLVGQKTRI
jgi:CRP-like cAMP-binding protein